MKYVAYVGLLVLSYNSLAAVKVVVGGNRTVQECSAVKPLVTSLNAVAFPDGWTVMVICNPVAWQAIQQKAHAEGTHTAFTNLKHRITVINGDVFNTTRADYGSNPPERVLRHELGHIRCHCADERRAENAGGVK